MYYFRCPNCDEISHEVIIRQIRVDEVVYNFRLVDFWDGKRDGWKDIGFICPLCRGWINDVKIKKELEKEIEFLKKGEKKCQE